MEKFLFSVILALIFISCNNSKSDNEKCKCLPEIIIETQKDTVSVGDKYVAKVSLSDGSFLFIKDHKGKKHAVLPVFKINGNLVESDENFYIYKETVTLENIDSTDSGLYFKEWTSSVIFPHPEWGDVELSQRNSYIIEK